MAADNKSKGGINIASSKGKRKRQFLPHNRPAKKKGAYPLRPGVQGFFITCDGGRERQASQEAIYVVDSFYEELVHGMGSSIKSAGIPNIKSVGIPNKPLNKKIVFASSSSDDDNNDEDDNAQEEGRKEEGKQPNTSGNSDVSHRNLTNEKSDPQDTDDPLYVKEMEGKNGENHENEAKKAEEPPAKKHHVEADASKCSVIDKVEEKSIDKLIEAELQELGDTNKRLFVNLDSGCNGVAFVQMRKRDGDHSPKDIVQHIMTSVASTRKPISRSILRVLPIEVSCYASEEEISRAIKPLVVQYFPAETQNPQKFAVLYEARANTGIDRMKIINSVAKSVPAPHKVDLSNPDRTIVVEIVKTVCMIGVVEKYKELSKFNLRQLTSPKQ